MKNAQSLLNIAIREQFLEEVVAVLIDHDIGQLLTDLLEEKFDEFWICFGQKMVLQESGSGLSCCNSGHITSQKLLFVCPSGWTREFLHPVDQLLGKIVVISSCRSVIWVGICSSCGPRPSLSAVDQHAWEARSLRIDLTFGVIILQLHNHWLNVLIKSLIIVLTLMLLMEWSRLSWHHKYLMVRIDAPTSKVILLVARFGLRRRRLCTTEILSIDFNL